MWLGLIPAVLAAAVLAGCGGGGGSSSGSGSSSDGGSSGGSTTSGSTTSGKRTALQSDGTGTIVGRVTVSKVPDLKEKNATFAAQMSSKAEFAGCKSDNSEEMNDPTWTISADGGVANAVVWVNPPKGKYFKLSDAEKDPEKGGWKKEVTLDQPHCAFLPHVTVLFPKYYDDAKAKLVPTGQEFTVTNKSNFNHNTKIKTSDDKEVTNSQLGPDTNKKVDDINPSSNKPYVVGCDVHNWMRGYIWAFEHPFAAKTDKDGKFEIKNVPAGAELTLMVWHEPDIYPTDKGETIKLEKGKTLEKNFTLEGPK
jgi:hypothetical protein